MTLIPRTFVALVVTLLATAAFAQAYPNKAAIGRVPVPFPLGGGTDIIAHPAINPNLYNRLPYNPVTDPAPIGALSVFNG